MANNLNEKVANNFIWRLMERIGAQGVTFVVSIVLARMLDPSVYGTIALVTVFTTILQVFIDSGLANALIQKKDADDLDFSTVFFFNVLMCIVLYFILFFVAPYIAVFYKIEELTPLIRALGITIVVSGVKNVQQAYVSRNLMFKKFFFATLGGTIGAAILGIYLAYRGFGAWALVIQHLFNQILDTIILWVTVKWRPKKVFSLYRLKELLNYGWKLLAAKLIDTTYNDLRALVIGKVYSANDLAFFNRGNQFPSLINNNINSSIDSVLLPALSKEQDDSMRVCKMTRRSISVSTYVLMPTMIGLAVCAEPIVRIVLTDKWLPCVPFMRIFCISYALQPVHTANLNAIKAMGRSDIFLKLEIIKKSIDLAALIMSMRISVIAMALSMLVTNIIGLFINAWPNQKMLGYSIINQIMDILPQIGLSAGMGLICYSVRYLETNDFITILIQVLLGITIYLLGSAVLNLEPYKYLCNILKVKLLRKNSINWR